MNAIHPTEFRTASDVALQIDLERRIAKRNRAEREMAARYAAQVRTHRRTDDEPTEAAAPAWLVYALLTMFSLLMTFAVWSFAGWFLPIVWGAK